MPWLTREERREEGIAAGKFGQCGRMTIKPYAVPEQHRERILREFWRHVTPTICGCWLWRGRVHNNYPVIATPEGSKWAHRVAFALFVGPIQAQRHIDHRCRNKLCVRPGHLLESTPIENYLAIHRRKRRDEREAQRTAGQQRIW